MILPPIDLDQSGNITALPIKPRPPVDAQAFLQPVPMQKCHHWRGPFEVDQDAGKCRCKECGEEVSPMFVLDRMMKLESRWMQTRAAYQDEMKRLDERAQTKCRNCGQMTRISKR